MSQTPVQMFRVAAGITLRGLGTETHVLANLHPMPGQYIDPFFRRGGGNGNTPDYIKPNPEHDLPPLTAMFQELPEGITVIAVGQNHFVLSHSRGDALKAMRFADRIVRRNAHTLGSLCELKIRWFGRPDGTIINEHGSRFYQSWMLDKDREELEKIESV